MKQSSENKSTTGRVSWKELIAYGQGGACYNVLGNAVNTFAMYVLNIGLGIAPTLVGTALAVPRLYDAVTDPVMGNISDRFRSRFGRRRPFILGGAIASGLCFFLLWQIPRSWAGSSLYFWAFIVLSLLYYTSVTVFTVPFLALGYELTENVKERTRVMAAFQIAASFSGVALIWLLPVTQWSIFSDTVEGMRWVAAPLGLMMAFSGLIVFRFCREHGRHVPAVGSAENASEKPAFLQSVTAALRNGPFMILCGVVVSMLLGIMSVMSLTPYIIIYYLKGGELSQGSVLIAANGTVWTVTGIIMVPLITWISGRLGKKRTLLFCLGAALFGNLLKWPLYSPEHAWTVMIPQFFVSLAFAALWTLVNSMVADSCDYSEYQSGKRVEGMLGGIYGWLVKLGSALAFFLAGLVLDGIGFDKALGAAQPAEVIRSMRLLEMGLPAAAYIGAILLLLFYPLSEQKMAALQQELSKRRA